MKIYKALYNSVKMQSDFAAENVPKAKATDMGGHETRILVDTTSLIPVMVLVKWRNSQISGFVPRLYVDKNLTQVVGAIDSVDE